MRSILIDDWIMETLSRHGDWLRVARLSLYQLVGHPVKSKPPTLAASPASSSTVLPQIDALAAEGLTEGVSEFFFKKNAFACEHTTRESPALRAISTMPAPSHICATLRRVTETCLFIKKMGPACFRINVTDPIPVHN